MKSTHPLAQPHELQSDGDKADIKDTTKVDILSDINNDHYRKTYHDTILDTLDEKCVNYVAFIKDHIPNEQGEAQEIVKIGWSNNINERSKALTGKLGNYQVIYAVECQMNIKLDKQLKALHANQKFKGEVYNGRKSTEVFVFSRREIENIKDYMKREAHRYNEIFHSPSPSEYKRNEVMNSIGPIVVSDIIREASELQKQQQEEEKKKLNTIDHATLLINKNTDRGYTMVRGDKVQRYSPDGKNLLETYECMIVASRDPKLDTPMSKSIKDSIKNKSVYKSFRWAFLKRDQNDDTVQDIGETDKSILPIKKGYVALLNPRKTQIEKVYCDMKAICEDLELKSVGSVSNAVKKESKCLGKYVKMWFDCDENLKKEYLDMHGDLPPMRVKPNGKPIEQICPFTDKVIKTYSSMSELVNNVRIARKSIINALDYRRPMKGFLWQYVGKKEKENENESISDHVNEVEEDEEEEENVNENENENHLRTIEINT